MPRPRGPAKLPYLQFFPADYLRDTRCLTPAARGLYMDLLCHLHDAPQRGSLTHPQALWIKLLVTCEQEFVTVLQELKLCKVCTITQNSHGNVTIKSRRMLREESIRKDWRIRQQRLRSHPNVTP